MYCRKQVADQGRNLILPNFCSRKIGFADQCLQSFNINFFLVIVFNNVNRINFCQILKNETFLCSARKTGK